MKRQSNPKRIKSCYRITFFLEVEQDETGDDKSFDVENAFTDALDTWIVGSSHHGVAFENASEIGAEKEK